MRGKKEELMSEEKKERDFMQLRDECGKAVDVVVVIDVGLCLLSSDFRVQPFSPRTDRRDVRESCLALENSSLVLTTESVLV